MFYKENLIVISNEDQKKDLHIIFEIPNLSVIFIIKPSELPKQKNNNKLQQSESHDNLFFFPAVLCITNMY